MWGDGAPWRPAGKGGEQQICKRYNVECSSLATCCALAKMKRRVLASVLPQCALCHAGMHSTPSPTYATHVQGPPLGLGEDRIDMMVLVVVYAQVVALIVPEAGACHLQSTLKRMGGCPEVPCWHC